MRKPLAGCSVALVSTAGVHLKSQPAHDLLNPHGDASFREIRGREVWGAVDVGKAKPCDFGRELFAKRGKIAMLRTPDGVKDDPMIRGLPVVIHQFVQHLITGADIGRSAEGAKYLSFDLKNIH